MTSTLKKYLISWSMRSVASPTPPFQTFPHKGGRSPIAHAAPSDSLPPCGGGLGRRVMPGARSSSDEAFQKLPRALVLRRAEQRGGRALLDDLAVVHED